MKHTLLRTVSAVLLAGALAVGMQAAPASAHPSYNTLPTNTWSPQYNVNGCLYKVHYGNYGSIAYAQMRIYNPTTCGAAAVALGFHDGTTQDQVLKTFASGYYTGGDGCGSYREVQATAPRAGYATHATTIVTDGSVPWSGIKAYSSDGLVNQPGTSC